MVNNNKFLITGASGQLAKEFIRFFEAQGFDYAAPGEGQLDITDVSQIKSVIKAYRPTVLLNCAAYNFVDKAEDEPEAAFAINGEAVKTLALACREADIFLVHFGSDYVFDGKKGDLYTEEDPTNPINVYGKSKLQGEEAVRAALEDFLVFRLSWVFGAGQQNFLYKLTQWAQGKESLKVVSDEFSIPTFTEDVAAVVMRALENGLTGRYHLANSGRCSRYEWAEYYFNKKGSKVKLQPSMLAEFPGKAKRPMDTAMSNKKICDVLGISVPTWQDATDRFIRQDNFKESKAGRQ